MVMAGPLGTGGAATAWPTRLARGTLWVDPFLGERTQDPQRKTPTHKHTFIDPPKSEHFLRVEKGNDGSLT